MGDECEAAGAAEEKYMGSSRHVHDIRCRTVPWVMNVKQLELLRRNTWAAAGMCMTSDAEIFLSKGSHPYLQFPPPDSS
jgi:hypothetical protein